MLLNLGLPLPSYQVRRGKGVKKNRTAANHCQPSYDQDQQEYLSQFVSQQFQQQGPYNSNPYPADPNSPYSPQDQQRYQQQYQQQSDQYGSTDPGAQAEGDRGLMGALAGGAAGAYGGHKLGHGIIGSLAGAFVGSKMEHKYKDRKGRSVS